MNTKMFMAFGLIVGFVGQSYADITPLQVAMQNARNACSGISDSMNNMKVKAGINTAVTGVGTVSGAVALGSGIAKANVDKEFNKLKSEVIQKAGQKVIQDKIDINNRQELEAWTRDYFSNMPEPDKSRLDELYNKSKKLGNIRTGTLAASTATNIVGTALAATNKVEEDLEDNINNCIKTIKDLSDAKLAAKMEGTATDMDLHHADKIINGCRDYEIVDLKTINKRATGAAVSSGIGIGTGVVGTITSAVANTDKTRLGDGQKEKNLNKTANIMAGASTVASATATIFNATQISAVKKVVAVADRCEEALQ